LRFVLDEHLRGPLWNAIRQHNARSPYPLDVVRVGDPVNLPLRTPDPDILLWAEREGRILVTSDKATVPGHLADHLRAGRNSAGVFVIRPGSNLPAVVSHLVLAAYASGPVDWEDRLVFIPWP
jgi:hypothetical protein